MSRMTIGRKAEAQISSQSSTRGFDISARPIATICCWPPDNAVRGLVAALASGPGTARRSLRATSGPAAAAVVADEQVLLDAERGKQLSPLRHHGDAALHDVGRRQRADRLAVESDRVGRVREHAGDGSQQRRLAGAVGADDGDGLAR